MPAPWRSHRRERYSGRAHAIATRHRSDDRAVANEAATPVETSWNARPGDAIAHAFSTGPGWTMSVCRKERWSVLWPVAPADTEHCTDCALLVDGAPGEITEAWGR